MSTPTTPITATTIEQQVNDLCNLTISVHGCSNRHIIERITRSFQTYLANKQKQISTSSYKPAIIKTFERFYNNYKEFINKQLFTVSLSIMGSNGIWILIPS